MSPGWQAWAIYESCAASRLSQVARPLIGSLMICAPPRVVWLAGALLAGLCSIDTRGTRCFRAYHTHRTALLRPASVHSHPLPPSNTINIPPSWCIFHKPADDLTIDPTTTIPLGQMLDLGGPKSGLSANAHLQRRWWAPDASLVGVFGCSTTKKPTSNGKTQPAITLWQPYRWHCDKVDRKR